MARTSSANAASAETTLPMGIMVKADAAAILPVNFSSEKFLAKLKPEEQSGVQEHSVKLARAMLINGASRAEMGLQLQALQGILEPHNVFGRFLKKYFRLSKRSAYRYIGEYENASKNLPEPIVKAAMARGLNLTTDSKSKPFGTYTDAVKALPPSQNVEPNAWLDAIENKKKELRQQARDAEGTEDFVLPEPSDPAVEMRACVLFVERSFKKLPTNSRTRGKWLQQLTSYLLAIGGVANPMTIAPQAIPAEFRPQPRGRKPTIETPAVGGVA